MTQQKNIEEIKKQLKTNVKVAEIVELLDDYYKTEDKYERSFIKDDIILKIFQLTQHL